MGAFKLFVVCCDVLMAVLMICFALKDIRDAESICGFALMIFLLLSSAGLIMWR